eukprot:1127040-Rhodomonas_salina.1
MAATNTKVLSMMVGMTKDGKMQPQIDNGAGKDDHGGKDDADAADPDSSMTSEKFVRLEDEELEQQLEM